MHDDVYQSIAIQFANSLLTGRWPVAAAAQIGNDAISEIATSRYRDLIAAAHHALTLYAKQTAPPSIAQEVVREVNGRSQTLQIVPPTPRTPTTDIDVQRMARTIMGHVCAASLASSEADRLCLSELPALDGGNNPCGGT